MAIRYHLDLYPRTTPKNGARLVRFTKLQSAEYRGEANGTGAGRFSLRGDTTDGNLIDPRGLQYVRTVREDTVAATEAVIGGFFLDNGDFTALDEKGTRLLTFGGAGTLSYLQRAMMASHSYLVLAKPGGGTIGGSDPFDDIWRLHGQWDQYGYSGNVATAPSLGGMLWRALHEAMSVGVGSNPDDRSENALPDLTLTFTWTEDSSGNLWSNFGGEFIAQVGESLLSVVKRLMEAGLYVELDPDTFELNAWPAATHRRVRTGVAWGASVIRFQSPTDGTIATASIKSDAKRGIAAFIKRKWMLAGGQDTYGDAVGTSDIPWEGFYPSDASDATSLASIAAAQIGARDDAGDTLRLRMKLGTTPTTGQYLPLETAGVLLDDLVTVHTGTGQWDYNEDTFPVAALTIVLREGGDWDAFADLGSSYTSMAERAFQARGVGTHNHPPNPRLCEPATISTESDVVLIAMDGEDGDHTESTPAYATLSQPIYTTEAWVLKTYSVGYYLLLDNTGTTSSLPRGASSAALAPCTPGDTLRIDWTSRKGSTGFAALGIRWMNGGYPFDTAVQTVSREVVKTWTQGSAFQTHSVEVTVPVGATALRLDSSGGGTTSTWHLHDFTITELAAASGVTAPGDGRPEAVGTSVRASRCDHRHDFHRDRAPNADDDSTQLYRVGQVWAQLDSLVSPTKIVGIWMLVDATAGAAVWAPWPVSAHEHDAASIAFTPTGTIAATDVQTGMAEIATDYAAADSTHAAAADPHTGYQKESEKGVANGYAGLGAGALVPMAQLATGTPNGTKFVRDDGTLATPASGGTGYHYEVLMAAGTSPPEPLDTGDGTDWLYALVAD